MTVQIVVPRKVYTGNDVASAFNVSDDDGNAIWFSANSEILVATVRIADGLETMLVEGVDYDLTGGPTAGVVTLTAGALASTYKLVIWRRTPLDQDVAFGINADFASATHNALHDKHRRIHQELADDISRAILADRSGIFVDVTDKIVKNAVAGVDDNDLVTLSQAQTMLGSSGSVDAAKTAAEAAADAAQSAYAALVAQSSQPGFTLTQYTQVMDDISGLFDGVSTTFPLTIGGTSKVPATAAQILVFLGGVYQTPTTSYTVADDQITFSDPPATGMICPILSIQVQAQPEVLALKFFWSTNTAASDPGSGYIKGDNATLGSITTFYLSETAITGDVSGYETSVFGSSSTIKAYVSLVSLADQNNWIKFRVDGHADSGSYRTLTGAVVSSAGSLALDDPLAVFIERTGDAGAVESFNTRTGAVTLTAADVLAAMPDDSVDLLTVYSLDRTGIGDTVTAINTGLAACAAAGVTAIIRPGVYRCDSPILAVSGARVVADGALFIKNFATTGGDGLLCTADSFQTTAGKISDVIWIGGNFTTTDNTVETFAGNMVSLWGDYITLINVRVLKYGAPVAGGRAFYLGGDYIRCLNCEALEPAAAARNGGCRFIGGIGFRFIGGRIVSSDDAAQLVPTVVGTADSHDIDVEDGWYIGTVVESTLGRAIAALVGNQTTYVNDKQPCLASIKRSGFIGLTGYGNHAQQCAIIRNTDSSGKIDDVALIGCKITSSTSKPLYVGAWICGGGVDNVDLTDCSFPGVEWEGYQTFTPGGSWDTELTAQSRTYNVRGGRVNGGTYIGTSTAYGTKGIRFTNATLDASGGGNALKCGTGTDAVARAYNTLVSGCRIINIANGQYGINNQMSDGTTAIYNDYVGASGATTAVALRNATLSGAVGGQNTFVNGGTVVDLGNTAAFTGALLNNSVVQNVRGYRSINAGGIIGSQMFYGSSSGSLSLQVAAAAGTSIIWQFPATNGTTGDVPHTDGAGVLTWGSTIGKVTTVASLTAAATAGVGARAFVTDATATTFASVVAGGGANNVPVYSDGTNWLIG